MFYSKPLIKTGRAFYAIGILAFGIQQLVIHDFRPEILPPFPNWAHQHFIFSFITGIALIAAAFVISGVLKIPVNIRRNVFLGLGFYFLLLIICFHLPYNLVLGPNKAIHMGVWAPMLKELAYCGGAFVLAGSFENYEKSRNSIPLNILVISVGRIFFSITMIIYGYSHFLYTDYISQMVPAWFGFPLFWTYFAGTALIGAGLCIMFKILLKPVAALLAIMIFLWFIVLHVPDAIRNPYLQNGNEIVSAFDALLFSGVAIVISLTQKTERSLRTKIIAST